MAPCRDKGLEAGTGLPEREAVRLGMDVLRRRRCNKLLRGIGFTSSSRSGNVFGWKENMRVVNNSVLLVCAVLLAGCPKPPKPPTVDASRADWCKSLTAVGIPTEMECQQAPGYYTLGLFGKGAGRSDNSFAFYIPNPPPQGLAQHDDSGPSLASFNYDAKATLDAGGGLDLSKLPTGVSKWLPSIKATNASKEEVTLKITVRDWHYFSLRDTIAALDSAIRQSKDKEACGKMATLRSKLCEDETQASVQVLSAIPVITIKSSKTSNLEIGATVSSVLGAQYTVTKSASGDAELVSDKPLALAVRWKKYSEDSCSATAPTCP
jgi:hypothetical protein